MSLQEMNVLMLKKTGLAAMLGGAALLSGCVSAFAPQTDPTSPLAPRVQQLVDENRQYPRWADFPRSSQPLPRPEQIAGRVATLQRAKAPPPIDRPRPQ